ncbi:MAG: tetraacyldisaccharide 4'-kinase [Proteobacteria bacterium]|nr:tetraacyldisaccharide 4'-kinase [Pseudomonadota bacterium]
MFDERELQSVWYGGRAPSLWLRALSLLFGTLRGLRQRLYATGLLPRVRLPVPVVVVGNITVGGTGKTPLTIALVEALRERGFKPGVVSRGYGGSARAAMGVDAHSDPAMVGDEARLIFDATHAPLAVGRDRVATAQLLLSSGEADVIVADDGLQHYRLHRDVEICVIDGERRFGNERLLPAGPLREPMARLQTVDFRVCNGGVAQVGEVPMTLVGDIALSMTGAQQRPLREFAGHRVHVVAGIGNPSRFFAKLRDAGIDILEHAFSDHHAYAASDLAFGDELPVLMTEKDAVKCAAFARPNWWSVLVRAQLPPHFFDAVAQQLRVGDKTR